MLRQKRIKIPSSKFLFSGSVLRDLRGNNTTLNSLLVWKQKKEEITRQRGEK